MSALPDQPHVSIRPIGTGVELSLLGLLIGVLERRRTILKIAFGASLLVAGATLVRQRTYTTVVGFIAQGDDGGLSRFSGLAAQFGVALPGGGTTQSPDFYAELIRSRAILGPLADTRFHFTAYEGLPFLKDSVVYDGDLISLFKIDEGDAAKNREEAVEMLHDELVVVDVGRETGIVGITVRTPWPGLSAALADKIMGLVTAFNLQTRQSQAAAERAFVESRLIEVREEQRLAEDRLQAFLQRNREFRNAPQLQFEYDRLSRDVDLRRQVVLGLTQSFEQARIEEVRNTPVITVTQRAEPAARPDRRRLALKTLVGLMLGMFVGIAWAAAADVVAAGTVVDRDEVAELVRIKREIVSSLRALIRFGRK